MNSDADPGSGHMMRILADPDPKHCFKGLMFYVLVNMNKNNFLIGSIEKRKAFRSERQCKPFSWYLANIYPEKFILNGPDQVFAYGRLRFVID